MIRPRRWLKAFGLQPIALIGTRFSVPFPCSENIGRKEITCVPASSRHPRYTATSARENYGSNGSTWTVWCLNLIPKYSSAFCIRCDREHPFRVSHDPYVAHQASDKPPAKVG